MDRISTAATHLVWKLSSDRCSHTVRGFLIFSNFNHEKHFYWRNKYDYVLQIHRSLGVHVCNSALSIAAGPAGVRVDGDWRGGENQCDYQLTSLLSNARKESTRKPCMRPSARIANLAKSKTLHRLANRHISIQQTDKCDASNCTYTYDAYEIYILTLLEIHLMRQCTLGRRGRQTHPGGPRAITI